MKELPAGLADPLHLASPFPFRTLGLLAALLMLGLLWMLWRRLRRRRPPAPVPAIPPPSDMPPAPGIGETIDAIRRRYLHADRRQGLHQLSASLRAHLEGRGRHRFSTLTAGEIVAAVGDVALSRFFDLLAELQFGRRKPSRSDFGGICDLARDVIATGDRR